MTQKKILDSLQSRIHAAEGKIGKAEGQTTLIAVSKTYFGDDVEIILKAGHRVFGENRVQEAEQKWPEFKNNYKDVELHLIGPLQSNKAKQAAALFDVVQTIDREKIAIALHAEAEKLKKTIEVYIQVNVGDETQKSGVSWEDLPDLVNAVRSLSHLRLAGLMCIPPADKDPKPYFTALAKAAKNFELKKLSMGMSADFEEAILCGATAVRIGSAIFGQRSQQKP